MKLGLSLLIVFFSILSIGAPNQPTPEGQSEEPIYGSINSIGDHGSHLDLDLSLGYPLNGGSQLSVRTRVGKMWVDGAWIRSLGAAAKLNTPLSWTTGIEGEILFVPSGLWSHAGLAWSGRDKLVGYATLGWSFIGLEYASEISSNAQWTLSASFRLPVGILLYALDVL